MTNTITFNQPARRVFTAVKHVLQTTDEFKRVEYDEDNFVLTASHGWSLIPTGQNIKIRVVAKGTQTTDVIIESKNKIFINIFGLPQSKRNVQTLSDFIQNRVYKLCSDEDIKLNRRWFYALLKDLPNTQWRMGELVFHSVGYKYFSPSSGYAWPW